MLPHLFPMSSSAGKYRSSTLYIFHFNLYNIIRFFTFFLHTPLTFLLHKQGFWGRRVGWLSALQSWRESHWMEQPVMSVVRKKQQNKLFVQVLLLLSYLNELIATDAFHHLHNHSTHCHKNPNHNTTAKNNKMFDSQLQIWCQGAHHFRATTPAHAAFSVADIISLRSPPTRRDRFADRLVFR